MIFTIYACLYIPVLLYTAVFKNCFVHTTKICDELPIRSVIGHVCSVPVGADVRTDEGQLFTHQRSTQRTYGHFPNNLHDIRIQECCGFEINANNIRSITDCSSESQLSGCIFMYVTLDLVLNRPPVIR